MNKEQTFSIGDFSAKTGISIRTLHYYDDLGLLKARRDPSSGHRLYTHEDLLKLQKIVSLKFLGYRLDQIADLIETTHFDLSLKESLQMQQKALEVKKEQIETSIRAVKRAITLLEEEGEMDSNVLMSLIRNIQKEKEQRLWLEQYTSKELVGQLYDKSEEEMIELDKSYVQMMRKVKKLVGKPVDAPEVVELIDEFLKVSKDFVGEQYLTELGLIPEDQVESIQRLVPSPLTDEEEEWLNKVFDHYVVAKGMFDPNQLGHNE
jgi:DNA-binding transcriptional MerR regulator